MISSLKACRQDQTRMKALNPDAQSYRQYVVDRARSKLIGRWPMKLNAVRTITLRPNLSLSYRLNKGDMQSLREVFLEEQHQLPRQIKRETLVDLGGNIGLSTLWLMSRYGCKKGICVEPSSDNADIIGLNIVNNNLPVELVRAAVGPMDGEVLFEANEASNIGRVGHSGVQVPMVSMNTILCMLPPGSFIDILKIDIEGGETALLTQGDRTWLYRVKEIVIEMHLPIVDRDFLIKCLTEFGFTYFSPNSGENRMDYFRRNEQ